MACIELSFCMALGTGSKFDRSGEHYFILWFTFTLILNVLRCKDLVKHMRKIFDLVCILLVYASMGILSVEGAFWTNLIW